MNNPLQRRSGNASKNVLSSQLQPRKPPGSRNSRFLILGIVGLVLCLLGLLMVLSASSVNDLQIYDNAWHHIRRQSIWFVLGLGACIVIIQIDYHRLRRFSNVAICVAGFLLLIVLIPGVGIEVKGSRRWLDFGPITVQPSEVAKLAIILFCADRLSLKGQELALTKNPLKLLLGVLVTFVALIMLEPDFGTTLVVAAIFGALIFFAGTQAKTLMQIFGVAVIGAVGLALSASYRRDRLIGLLDPWSDALGSGWQPIQAGAAVANGGISGVGFGESTGKWGWLPEAHTDFIYAIIAEEMGLIGSLFVIALYMVIGFTGLSTALNAPDAFGRLLAAGTTTWIMIQAFVNIGAVLGLLPITGITLPFLSFGGNALLSTLIAYGILLNVARQSK